MQDFYRPGEELTRRAILQVTLEEAYRGGRLSSDDRKLIGYLRKALRLGEADLQAVIIRVKEKHAEGLLGSPEDLFDHLRVYRSLIELAYADQKISGKEKRYIKILGKVLMITPEEHHQVVSEIKRSLAGKESPDVTNARLVLDDPVEASGEGPREVPQEVSGESEPPPEAGPPREAPAEPTAQEPAKDAASPSSEARKPASDEPAPAKKDRRRTGARREGKTRPTRPAPQVVPTRTQAPHKPQTQAQRLALLALIGVGVGAVLGGGAYFVIGVGGEGEETATRPGPPRTAGREPGAGEDSPRTVEAARAFETWLAALAGLAPDSGSRGLRTLRRAMTPGSRKALARFLEKDTEARRRWLLSDLADHLDSDWTLVSPADEEARKTTLVLRAKTGKGTEEVEALYEHGEWLLDVMPLIGAIYDRKGPATGPRAPSPEAERQFTSGTRLLSEGRPKEALEAYAAGLELEDGFAYVHNNMAHAYEMLDDDESAISEYQKAIQIDATYPLAYNNLGTVYERKGRTEEALALYRKAIELKPDYSNARYNLGVLLGRQGKLEEAAHQFKEVVKLKPDDAYAHKDLGIAYSRLGRDEEAKEHFDEAERLGLRIVENGIH